jgi:hypothetical protein
LQEGSEQQEMTVPNGRERQLMQQMRDAGWVKASAMPSSPITLNGMIDKGWIERRGEGRDLSYRITETGLAAKTMPLRVYK